MANMTTTDGENRVKYCTGRLAPVDRPWRGLHANTYRYFATEEAAVNYAIHGQ